MNGSPSQRSELEVLIGLGVVLAAPVCVVWLTGTLASVLASGHPLQIGLASAARVLTRLPSHLGRPELAWPANTRRLLPGPLALQIALASCTIILLTLLGGALVFLAWLTRRDGHRRAARFASRGELAELRVRYPPSGRVILGLHHRTPVAAETRASVLLVGPSQAGKTRGLVVPALLEWDGPLLSTSIKSDVVHYTHVARAKRGEVRIFDPTGSCGLPSAPWSPIVASRSWEGARRTAARLLGVGEHALARSADEAFWRPAGSRFLAPLLLAAAHGDLTMREVLSWIATTEEKEPAELLESCPAAGAQPALEALQSVWDADPRFRSSLLQTIATGLDPWQEPQIAAATIGDSQISADWLLDGPNTLYLIAPVEDQRRLRGLFVALLADITAGAFAESAKTGKPIDPALLLALDEVANIAPLPNLDEIASTGPGQGVQLLSVFQDISQAADRWGRERSETIFANHRARLFTSGIGDRATLEYLSHTLGEEEIARVATHRQSSLAPGSRTHSSEFRALAAPNRVRQQDSDTALLIYGRLAPAWLQLRPWYKDATLNALAAGQPAPTRLAHRLSRPVRAVLAFPLRWAR